MRTRNGDDDARLARVDLAQPMPASEVEEGREADAGLGEDEKDGFEGEGGVGGVREVGDGFVCRRGGR